MSKKRPKDITPQQRQEIVRLRETGMTYPAIAERLGISANTARRTYLYHRKQRFCKYCGESIAFRNRNARYCSRSHQTKDNFRKRIIKDFERWGFGAKARRLGGSADRELGGSAT